jgi:sugar phosphate permease
MKRRHLVLSFLVGLGLITFLDRICISVAGKRIMDELALDPAQWGWVHSAFILSYGIFQVPIGTLADKHGPRAVIALIVLWWSTFTAATALAQTFGVLIAIRFLFGIGEAGAYPAMAGVVARWFPTTERAMAQGFIWGASRLGGALSPLIVVPVQQVYGWRAAFWMLGVIGIFWALAWYAWFRNRPEAKPGVSAVEIAEINAGKSPAAQIQVPWRLLLASSQFWVILTMYFFYVWGSWFYFTWMPTYLEKGRGFSEDEMKIYAALPFILGVFSNVIGGYLSDALTKRHGRKVGRLVIGSVSLAGAALCLAITATAPAGNRLLIVASLALGFGVMDLMLPASWAICLDVSQKYAGTVSGAMNTAGSLGGFLCAAVFGALVQRYQDYNLPLMVIAGMLFISAILFTRIRPDVPLVQENH